MRWNAATGSGAEHQHGLAWVCFSYAWLTALALSYDSVGTKFIGGHGDVTLGILSVKGQELAKRVYFLQVGLAGSGMAWQVPLLSSSLLPASEGVDLVAAPGTDACPSSRDPTMQNAEGAGLAPFDCWLALRGLKTMSLRMERSADNCAVGWLF